MALLDKSGITNGNIVDASHVTNIYDTLNGTGSFNVNATGSFTGSFTGVFNGTAATASYAISASHEIIKEVSSSYAETSSYANYLYGTPSINVTQVTASSDISSSGIITSTTASHDYIQSSTSGEIIKLDGKDAGVSLHRVDGGDTSLLDISDGITLDINDGANQISISTDGIEFVGPITTPITASSDISSSGDITANAATVGPSSGYTGSLAITTPLLVQNNSNAYIGIFSPTSSLSGIYMGSAADTFGANIIWGYNAGKLTIGARQVDHGIDFLIGNKASSSLSLTPVSTNLTNYNSILTLTGSFIHGTSSSATGDYSHAEGRGSIASGYASHAEGLATVAEGDYSHAQGRSTHASGSYSHAEGRNSLAYGSYSHTVGYLSTASGNYSHAGGLSTVTNANYQYAIGQYNISSSDDSALIVGDGADANNRSNILFAGNNKIELNAPITASGNISSSGTVSMITASIGGGIFTSASLAGAIAGGGGSSGIFSDVNGYQQTINNLIISSSNPTSSLSVIGSGSTVFDVIGSVGTLFSVDDDLTGTLFTANDISGFPVLEASASGEVFIGKSPQSLYTTAVISATSASNSQSLCTLSTSSYDGAFFDYTITSASNAKAGNIMSIWNGGIITHTETSTTDIGTTAGITFDVIISQSQAQLVAITDSTAPNIWKVKTIIKAI